MCSNLYGRLGGAYAWTENEISFANVSETGKKHGAAFVGALGAEYTIDRDWAARLEYQYTTPLGDTSLNRSGIELDNGLISFGMLYRFGQQGARLPHRRLLRLPNRPLRSWWRPRPSA